MEHYYNRKFCISDIIVKKPIVNVYAGLPRKGAIFRISPLDIGEAYVFYNTFNKRWYILHEELGQDLVSQQFIQGLYMARLYHGIEENGNEFISVITLAGEKSSELLYIMEAAKNCWYERMDRDDEICFSAHKEKEKDMPRLGHSYTEIHQLAFDSRYIDSLDHPVIVNHVH